MKKLTLLALLLHTSFSLACEGYLPPNDLYLPLTDKNEGLSELQYEKVIDKVEKVYAPVVKDYGAVLKIDRLWESGTVNAGTFRTQREKVWLINLYGGLPRHRFMTEDGFALVICHEIGHHIGGAPKKIINNKKIWSSTEGQSDYWATLKCLRRIFKDDDNHSIIQEFDVPSIVTKECEDSFSSKKESALCIRLAMASKALTKISSTVRATAPPEFDTPDSNIVEQVFDKHPVPQCRLDSYFQGALCTQEISDTVSQQDDRKGTCHAGNSYQTGRRPLCWYSPSNF